MCSRHTFIFVATSTHDLTKNKNSHLAVTDGVEREINLTPFSALPWQHLACKFPLMHAARAIISQFLLWVYFHAHRLTTLRPTMTDILERAFFLLRSWSQQRSDSFHYSKLFPGDFILQMQIQLYWETLSISGGFNLCILPSHGKLLWFLALIIWLIQTPSTVSPSHRQCV